MESAQAVATIPAPPAEVFDFVANPENLPGWQTGILSAERTSPGPVGPGSTARVVRELFGQRIAADLAITVHEPGRRLELESTVSGIRLKAIIELSPEEHATRLRLAMRFAADSPLLAPIEAAVARAAQQDLATSLERLRQQFSERGEPEG